MFQVGLPSTWIQPENFDFRLPLCPKGTFARDEAEKEKQANRPGDWSEREKVFFRDVFQTIEGGVGFWGTTQFPTKLPKYRINGVPDCYTTPIGSPGWPFGKTTALADQAMGLAQLSNRILVPPDGMPFAPGSEIKRFGLAWMALPLTDYDGYFLLQTKQSGAENKCLERRVNRVVLTAPSDSSTGQLWKLVPSVGNSSDYSGPAKEGYFYLETRLEARAADFGGGKLWKMVPAGDDYYYLQTSKSEGRNECLDGKDDVVHMAPRSNADTQLWRLVPQFTRLPGKIDVVATGDSSWTLFLNSENFKGPVAFFPPTTWSRISKQNLPAVGRGLDARMGVMGSAAMEFNVVPGLQASHEGKTYLRIPKLAFPTEQHGSDLVTPLMQDMMVYSREGIYAAVMSWFANGPAASGAFGAAGAAANRFEKAVTVDFDQQGEKLRGVSDLVEISNLGGNTSCSWGLVWREPPAGSGLLKGQFPEYFVDNVATPASSIPAETGLSAATFTPPYAGQSYVSPASSEPAATRLATAIVPPPHVPPRPTAWTRPGPSLGPLTVTLGDGTQVTYAWYLFVDQPALQNLNLTAQQKSRLQSRIELIHKTWKIDGNYMKPPSVGSLVSMDPNLIVTPPKGLEAGYVPIVTKQERA